MTPYLSITDDLPAEAFLEAIEEARRSAYRDLGLELQWIFDIPADFGMPAAELTASVALDHEVPGAGRAWSRRIGAGLSAFHVS